MSLSGEIIFGVKSVFSLMIAVGIVLFWIFLLVIGISLIWITINSIIDDLKERKINKDFCEYINNLKKRDK